MTQTQALPTEAASPNHRFGHAVIAAAALVIAVAIALVTLVLMRDDAGAPTDPIVPAGNVPACPLRGVC